MLSTKGEIINKISELPEQKLAALQWIEGVTLHGMKQKFHWLSSTNKTAEHEACYLLH